jgi:hypothetical protein
MSDILDHLNRSAAETSAIRTALETHGAAKVHRAALAVYAGDKTQLGKLLGLAVPDLGLAHAADAAAFAALNPSERAADLAEAESDLSGVAAALGRRGGLKGGKTTGGAKAAAARANGRLGGVSGRHFYVEEAVLGQTGFILQRTPQRGDETYSLADKPGRKNMSGEACLKGWLGETNNVHRNAHGVGRVARVYKNGRGAVVQLDDAAAAEWLTANGWGDLVE